MRTYLVGLIKETFVMEQGAVEHIYDERLQPHLEKLKDNIHFLIESPYVDRVYRDGYYKYFSTKRGNYPRDCIRLSLFEGSISPGEFRDSETIQKLQKRYRGFIVLRPTPPNIIGRSVLSPSALKVNDFLCLTTRFHSSVNGVKFEIDGFPHSSQDGETITCAETSLWAVMEYFGHKYNYYTPVLPSVILESLRPTSSERQIPSRGLHIEQLAYALRGCGFGARIYSRKEFSDVEFKRLFSTYVESGLPLIVSIDNSLHCGEIAHAILCTGHAVTRPDQIDLLPETVEQDLELKKLIQSKNIRLYDNDDLRRDFVFIDDNQPVYQLATLDQPATHYTDDKWHNCSISNFIVPLYTKVYLEAYEAKNYFKNLFLNRLFVIPDGSELFIRMYLTSGRSFKDELARSTLFSPPLKEIILETAMPKFIWVGEVSTKDLIKKGLANGLLLLDATEPNLLDLNALIFASHGDFSYYYDRISGRITKNNVALGEFFIYNNNLKGF